MADGSIHIDTKIDSSGLDKQLDDLKGSLESMGKTLSVAVTAPLVAMGAFATKAFADAEKGDARLRASLEMTGQNVDAMFDKYQRLGSAIQEVTDIDDDAVKSLATFGTQLGITSDQMESAIKGAIGLSKITGADLQQSMKMVAMAAQGEFMMLERLSPEMRAAKTDAEKLAIAQKLMANGYKLATAEGKTFGGLMSMIKNDIGDLGEQFGQIIAEALLPFARWFRDVVKGFQQLSPETKKTIVAISAVVAAIGPALLAFAQMVKAVQMVRAAFVALEAAQIAVAATTAGIAALIIGWVALAILAFTDWGKAIADLPVGLQKALVEMLKLVIDFTKKFLDKIENIMNVLYGLTALVGVGIFGKAAFEGLQFLVKKASENVDAELGKIKTRADKTKPSIDKFGAALDDIQAKADNMAGGVSSAADAVEELDYRTQNFAFLLGRNLRELAGDVSITDTVKNMFRNFSQEFANADSTLFMMGFGVNEEVAKGISAGMHIATSAVKGLVENMAAAFQKTMEIFSGVFSILSWMADFSPTDMYNSFKSFIDGVADFILNDLGSLSIFFRDSFDLVGGLVSSIMANLPVLLETLGNVITYMVNYFVQNGPRLISQIVEIIGKVFIVLVESFPDIFRAAFVGIMAAIDKLIDIAPALIDAIATAISEVIVYIGKNAQALTKALTALFIVALLGIIDNMPQIIAALVEAFPYIVMAFAVDLPIALVKASPQIVKALVLALGSILYRVPIALGRALRDIGGDIIRGLEKGMTEAIPRMWSNVKKAFDKFIRDVKAFFGIASPSKLFFSFGQDIIRGLVNGIMSMGSLLISTIKNLGAQILAMASSFYNIGAEFGNSLLNGIVSMSGKIAKSLIGSLQKAVNGLFMNMKSLVFDWITEKISGMYETIANGTWSYIKGKVVDLIPGGGGGGFIDDVLDTGGDLIGGVGGLFGGGGGGFWNVAMPTPTSMKSLNDSITLNNVMTGTLTVDGREIGRIAFNNLDRYAMGAYGIKR